MTVNPHDRVMTREELVTGVADVEGLLCLLTDTIDAEIMAAAPKLRGISNYAVGFNNIDVAEATRRGLPVSNTPGVLTDTTADLAFTLIMATARRIVEADKFTREGKYEGWGPMLFLGADVYGKTLGLVGLGRIGSAVAKRAHGFDMKVLYFDERRLPEAEERALGVTFTPFAELLAKSDFISLHVPLLPSTHHLIGQAQFEMMKKTAILVNTSRGPVVDEKALVQALKSGRIGGAGLDVFEEEPKLAPGLAECWNAVIVPHIASASIETRTKMAEMAAVNLLAMLEGRVPENIVNPEVYDKK
jgi:glyoxylate reductase